jgi:hypothetical protein
VGAQEKLPCAHQGKGGPVEALDEAESHDYGRNGDGEQDNEVEGPPEPFFTEDGHGVDGTYTHECVSENGKAGNEEAHPHGPDVHGFGEQIGIPLEGEAGGQQRAEPLLAERSDKNKGKRRQNVGKPADASRKPQGAAHHGQDSLPEPVSRVIVAKKCNGGVTVSFPSLFSSGKVIFWSGKIVKNYSSSPYLKITYNKPAASNIFLPYLMEVSV